MIGKRVQPNENGWRTDLLQPGEYVLVNPIRMENGDPVPEWVKKQYPIWLACSPNGHTGNLAAHTVTEHEDGTITVSPSILISTRRDGKDIELFHGYLERGVWREA
jgi:hypothetical protein